MKKIVLGLVIVCALGAAALLLSGGSKPAPAANFTLLDNRQVGMESLRGKVVLVNFWATSCSSCVNEMPMLVETHHKFNAKGFETVAVAMSYDPPDFVREFTVKNQLPFLVALDRDGSNAQAFGGIRLTPTSILIDRQGNIVRQFLGEPDVTQLHQQIAALLG